MPSKLRRLRLVLRWLALTLLGYLAYALGRATLSFMGLGLPWYDWQWYLALLALPLALLWVLALGWPRRRYSGPFLLLLTLWLAAGYAGFGQTQTLAPAAAKPVPISFWAGEYLGFASDALLQDIKAAGGALYLNLSEASLEGERRQVLINQLDRLQRAGLGVYLVVNVGNYVSSPVAAEWAASVRKVAQFVQAEHFTNVLGLVGDAEIPYQLPLDPLGQDSASFDSAVQTYDRLLTDLTMSQPDLKLGFTAQWPQYVDQLDGDSDLARLMRSPVDPAPRWAYINLMAYTSYLPDPAWRPYFLWMVERELPRQFAPPGPHPVGFLIGIVGYPPEPLLSYDELVRDARLSRALGVDEVVVFRLEGSLKQFGPNFVQRLTADVNGPAAPATLTVPFARPVSLLLFGQLALDALLDIGHGLAGLAVVWAGLCAVYVYQRFHPTRPSSDKH